MPTRMEVDVITGEVSMIEFEAQPVVVDVPVDAAVDVSAQTEIPTSP